MNPPSATRSTPPTLSNPSTSARYRAVLLALLAALATALGGAVPALAAPAAPAADTGSPSAASRFWGYYQLNGGQWSFASTGPDDATPADGAVEGWRYATATMEAPRYPRATPTFEQLCAQTPAQQGSKRVGVLIDYGRPADAADAAATPPQARGACAVVPADASGTDVLAAVATHRMEGAMLCGVDGYPASGCFEQVASPSAQAAEPDQPVTPVMGAGGNEPTATPGQSADQQAAPAQTDQPAAQSGAVGAATWVIVGLLIVVAAVAGLALTLLRHRRQR